jgi:hypothetical protein
MLQAQGKSPATRKTYGTAVRQLAAFLTDRGMPVDVAGITRSTSRRSWPTCSPGAGRRRLPGPGRRPGDLLRVADRGRRGRSVADGTHEDAGGPRTGRSRSWTTTPSVGCSTGARVGGSRSCATRRSSGCSSIRGCGSGRWPGCASTISTSRSAPPRSSARAAGGGCRMRPSTVLRLAEQARQGGTVFVFVFVGLVGSEKGGYVAQRGHDATRFMAQVQGPVPEASGDRRRASSISASVVAYQNVHWPPPLVRSAFCPVSFASTGGALGVT